MWKKTKYNEDYLSFGFTFIDERDGTQKPQCFLCGMVLVIVRMKPAKLKEHIIVCSYCKCFRKKSDILCEESSIWESWYFTKTWIYRTQKPLQYDVIHSRIVDMSSNTLNQVLEELVATPFLFSKQLDETINVSQFIQLFFLFAMCMLIPLKKNSGFANFFWKLESHRLIWNCE